MSGEVTGEVQVAPADEEVTPLLTADETAILAALASGAVMRHRITYPTGNPAWTGNVQGVGPGTPQGPVVVSDFTGLSDGTGVNAYKSLTRWHAQGLVSALEKYTDGTQAYRITFLGKRFLLDNGGTVIETLTPATAVHATTNVLLTVNGGLFKATSQIYFNNAAQTTTMVSPTQLQCTIATVPAAGNIPVFVRDSGTTFASNTLTFVAT